MALLFIRRIVIEGCFPAGTDRYLPMPPMTPAGVFQVTQWRISIVTVAVK
jgi:hypothetical protein